MLRRNRSVHNVRCAWGCCTDGLNPRMERRIVRRRENRQWRKNVEA